MTERCGRCVRGDGGHVVHCECLEREGHEMAHKAEPAPLDLGPVRRWREGNVYYAENDFIRLAWAVTDDPGLIGELGVCDGIFIEWMDREKAKTWDGDCA